MRRSEWAIVRAIARNVSSTDSLGRLFYRYKLQFPADSVQQFVKRLITAKLGSFSLCSFFMVGSAEERKAVKFAHKFSTRREYEIYKAEREDVEFSLEVLDDVAMGDSFDISVVVHNRSDDQRTVKVNITSVMAFYTGIPAKPLKREMKTLNIDPRAGAVMTRVKGVGVGGKHMKRSRCSSSRKGV